ncbi:type IV pilus secretin PilQ [Echinimonas agarilytica]|uniref:Type IV pilus secretin PilQ family protein n=1 Tax=Echinimonas agarilytica TaxID=1215918 RepID=A0AA41W4I6_9GAMM|nr:type IV pilus secretin PilQ family protein [Echinimonas agarilytica]MCM2678343.1 type IV pilus secretin PilQ family protein [Echinimonas agarilytica]
MKWRWRTLLVQLCWLPLIAMANPQLIDVRYNSLDDQQFALELVFDQPFLPPSTTVANLPEQVILKFPEANSAMALSSIPVSSSGVQRVNLFQTNEGLAVHTLVDRLRPYQGSLQGNSYILTLGAAESNTKKDSGAYLNRISSIDFRRAGDEGGELLVFMDNSAMAADVGQDGNRITLSFFDVAIGDAMIALLDVSDFGTLVQSVDVTRDKRRVMMNLAMNDSFSFTHEQIDNLFSLKVVPKSGQQIALEQQYTGKAISLNFQDIPVRTVLQIIADYNGFNLVTTDSVNGNITLRLDGVPWDQALDMILKIRGLGKRMEGNILLVAPAEELAIREAQELRAQQEVEKLAPLFAEYVQINYAKADTIASLLKNEEANMLSERGSVTVDERTNTILVRDTAVQLEEVRRLVAVLDRPVKQVLIESRVVNVRDNVSEELGIRWGVTNTFNDGSTSGSLEGAESANQGQVPSVGDRLNVDLPVANAAGSIAFQVAKLADGTIIDLELSALEIENKGEVVASPRITTANQKPAYIEQGVEIPYEESTSSGATNIEFKKAVLSLRVTPHITPDNRIILDLVITQDSQGEEVPTSAGGRAVAIDKQEIGTQVLVDNGETVVLGGIYQQSITHSVSKVPILGDLPAIGWMFRNTKDSNEKRELLIFVTPRIITDGL